MRLELMQAVVCLRSAPRERKGRCAADFSGGAACAVDAGHLPAFQIDKSAQLGALGMHAAPF